ncbi:MAG: DUF3109 family protein [Bacteroidales bacterium]|nr:DUF3109 family protein [Bacteroidales bacterium]
MITRDRSFIFEIGGCLVSSEILTEYFACDFEKCHGACCIIGDSGAPLEGEEVDSFRKEFDNYRKYMTPEGIGALHKQGFGVVDQDGDLVTPLVNGEECVYTSFDSEHNCFCATELAYCKGECKFRKPISCALYPIRISTLSNGVQALNLHRWSICKCAFEKGKKEKVPVYVFLREPIIRKFGEEFYSALEAASKSLQDSE